MRDPKGVTDAWKRAAAAATEAAVAWASAYRAILSVQEAEEAARKLAEVRLASVEAARLAACKEDAADAAWKAASALAEVSGGCV